MTAKLKPPKTLFFTLRGEAASQAWYQLKELRSNLEKIQNITPTGSLTNTVVIQTALVLAGLIFEPRLRLLDTAKFAKMAATMLTKIEHSVQRQIRDAGIDACRLDLSELGEDVEKCLRLAADEAAECRPNVTPI